MNFRMLILATSIAFAPDFGGGFNPGNARDISDALSRALGGDSNGGALLSALRASSGLGGAGNMAFTLGDAGQSLDVNGIMRLVDQRVARALSGIRGIGVAMPVRSSSQDIDNASETLTITGTYVPGMRVRMIVVFSGPTTVQVNQRSFPNTITATMDGGALWSSQALGFVPTASGGFECWATIDRGGTSLAFSLSSSYLATDDGILTVQVFDADGVTAYTSPGPAIV